MKAELRAICCIKLILLFIMFLPLLAHAQADPQELKKQACEGLFAIIIQCQLSAESSENNCDEVSGVLSSPQTRGLLSQCKPDGASDMLLNQTVAHVVDMCRTACQSAKGGNLYKTAQDWIDSGGCTIQDAR